ncbi:MAG: chemotaxis protein CheD [Methanosarcina sp.]|jgi:chemotaxis protein CheD|nr:chemotaxis protein CheD [Methanosarcina sp.]MDD3316686.1 chemotaxis protein CheD [Methanosarcina sp.]MDD4306592.1 chemotaxis protein CheD [Methanosarcina sp.]MDD4619306.1 chemotaxis protein CheD [Methanosarcina sp.]NLN44799.1 chemotaxis protein CheD [Methanosarcina sp.]
MTDSGIVVVGIGACAVARSPVKLKTFGLGSCVGIVLYDRRERIGGLVHTMLPAIDNARIKDNSLKYTDSGIEYLVNEIVKKGSSIKRLEAKLVGGAKMFENWNMNIGERNIKSARNTLRRLQIPIVAEDTGKNYGRTVTLDTSTGDLLIRTILRGDKII